MMEESCFNSFSLPPSSGLVTLEGEGQFIYDTFDGIVDAATKMGIMQVSLAAVQVNWHDWGTSKINQRLHPSNTCIYILQMLHKDVYVENTVETSQLSSTLTTNQSLFVVTQENHLKSSWNIWYAVGYVLQNKVYIILLRDQAYVECLMAGLMTNQRRACCCEQLINTLFVCVYQQAISRFRESSETSQHQ